MDPTPDEPAESPLGGRCMLADLAATEAFAGRIAALLRPGDVVLLDGELGAGKTALARALLRTLSHDAALEVPSPSYTLVQSYETRVGIVHHFDLWRLQGESDLVELGWDEALWGIVLVEWPDRLGTLAPEDALRLHLAVIDDDARLATWSGWARRGL